VQLSSDLACYPLDDELVVFSEKAQSLVGLNATAASLVRKLQDGAAAPELADALASEWGVAPGMAQDWVSATLEGLASHGLLGNEAVTRPLSPPSSEIDEGLARQRAQMPPLEVFEPHVVARYRLLETRALIRYGHKDQMRMVDTVIGHLKSEEEGEPNFIIDIPAAGWKEEGKRQAASFQQHILRRAEGRPGPQAFPARPPG